MTEGVYIPHASSGFDPNVPHMYGDAALDGWRNVTQAVHAEGGHIFAQLWHVGMQVGDKLPPDGSTALGSAMSIEEIEAIVAAYGQAAENAKSVGFDGIEIHGAHGYLIDQFLWERTNRRTDKYGGTLIARTRFASDVIAEVRRRVGPGFPISLRFSQFKIENFEAHLAKTPADLDRLLAPLVASGIDVLHASARKFWEPAFHGSDLTLAGWTRKLTGLPTIAVGSVTLNADVMTTFRTTDRAAVTDMDILLDCMERDEFDMVAIGRALLANPDWARVVEAGQMANLHPFDRSILARLE
jgi:2,4-dienoyl-CoA reductase-like NADH-dependent reductase (Old Yellow Enzyme family)